MKHIVLISIVLLSVNLWAQEKKLEENSKKDYSAHVLTIDSTIKSLYTVISGEKGVERDWDLFKFLFHPGAKLIASGKNIDGEVQVAYMSPDEYIKNSGKWMFENGFFENEIHRTVETFGTMSQVFSTYEAFNSEEDEKPLIRGINSFQLFNDGERWWIINIFWAKETRKHKIPNKYKS
ncbi:MAG: hypothetical protein ACK5MZ_10325 [Aestuariibaculum sp.]